MQSFWFWKGYLLAPISFHHFFGTIYNIPIRFLDNYKLLAGQFGAYLFKNSFSKGMEWYWIESFSVIRATVSCQGNSFKNEEATWKLMTILSKFSWVALVYFLRQSYFLPMLYIYLMFFLTFEVTYLMFTCVSG